MLSQTQKFAFNDFFLDAKEKVLLRGGKPLSITPKAFQLLLLLVENHGHLIEKDELMRTVWADSFVEEGNLSFTILLLRKALGDSSKNPRFIETVPKRGYRFIAEVSCVEPKPAEDLSFDESRSIKSETPPYSKAASTNNFASDHSIAVLPFVNISPDADNEYFCDGLTEELINALAKIENLKVAARTSAFSFKDKNIEIGEIGSILNVGAILEGSVRKSGKRLRIMVQLINAADGYHLWSERYDRELENIFDVQDEITLAVVDALKVNLLGEKNPLILKHYTENTAAYEAYLKGRFFWNKRTNEGFRKSIEYFEQAITEDRNYALAFAGLADCYNILGYYEMLSPEEVRRKAGALLSKALEIDDALGETHASLGVYKALYEWDWKGSERAFAQSLKLYRNNATTLIWSSVTASANGRFEEAVEKVKRAQELDPLSPIINTFAGWMYYYARRFDEAEKYGLRTIEIAPQHFLGHWLLGTVYRHTGRHNRAISELRQSPISEAELGRVYALAGRRAEAENVLNNLTEKSKRHYVSPVALATVCLGLGKIEEMFAFLENALAEGSTRMQWFMADPLNIEMFGADPRFLSLIRRMKLKPALVFR